MDISFVGSGHVAFVLAQQMKRAGHRLVEITGRNAAAVEELAQLTGASPHITADGLQPSLPADLYVIALSDTVLRQLPVFVLGHTGIWVHTAGAVPLEVLQTRASRTGVLYPLQSLRKEKSDYTSTPFLLQASEDSSIVQLEQLVSSMDCPFSRADDEQRLKAHLAAVFANNFTNHMLAIASAICRESGLPFSLLGPLVEETALRARQHEPAAMQTGPAIRGDEATMQTHLQMLASHPAWQTLYAMLSENIRLSARP